MTDYVDQTFNSGTVQLDGNTFKGCKFDKCELVYSGGKPPSIEGCQLDNFSFRFGGPAANTVTFLRFMSAPGSGLQRIVQDTFPTLSA